MANTIRMKRRVTGAAGAPATLASGEIAYNMADGYLYIGKGDNAGAATSVVAFARDTFVDPSGTYQPLDADLTNFGNLDATAGLLIKTGAEAYARRTLTGTTGRVAISNGNGVAGNPTIDLETVTLGSTTAGGYTKVTVDNYGRVTNGSTATLNDLGAPTGDFSMNSFRLTNLATPTAAADATTKAYVDNLVQGIDPKPSVRVASVANQALTGGTAFPTIDGVTVAAGNRVLLKNQTTAAENGIYVVGGTATSWTLTRAADADSWDELVSAFTFVEEGGTHGDQGWLSTVNAGGTLGTTAVAFTQFSGTGSGGFVVAGAGLTSSGTTVDVAAGTGITTAGDTVALDGQALALHNVTTAANQLIYATGAATFATTALTANARALLDDVNFSDMRTTLGLGTAATQNTGTSGANVPLLSTANTWTTDQTFSGLVSTAASTTTAAGLRVPHGTGPTTPTNGDLWSTTTTLNFRLNGASKTVAFTDSNITGSAGSTTAALTINNGGSGAASGSTFNGSTAITISHNSIGAVALAGSTMTGTLVLPAATTSIASIRVPHGTAPTTPTNGDLWTTTTALQARMNGATKTVAFTDSNISGSAGSTTAALTINNAGTGATSGSTFNGSTAVTISHNSIGAVALAGSTMTGQLVLPAATSSAASIRLPHGTAPTTPVNGDVWTTTSAYQAVINGVTKSIAFLDSNITGTAANVTGTVALTNGGTGATSAADARTNLGLGTMATQNKNAVDITGGSIDNITLDGGTY